MRQLTALDQQFLALEDSRHYGHVGGLAILARGQAAWRARDARARENA